jgi:alpha-tubulin suppressor-like RCC1 family protein
VCQPACSWGHNNNGQIGDNTTTQRNTPTAVIGLPTNVVSISAGGSNSCAVLSTGEAYCWGSNSNGQIGNVNAVANQSTPLQVLGLSSKVIASMNARNSSTCLLLTGGAVKCWGANTYGQIGDATTTSSASPVDVKSMQLGTSYTNLIPRSVVAP